MRILCIGDSNTWGYNPENGLRHEKRWTKILAEKMPENEIIEEGLNGRTILSDDTFAPERKGISSLKMLLRTHKPVDLVILMLGTNELKMNLVGTAKYIAKGIEEFLKIILDKDNWGDYKPPRILVVSPVLIRDELITRGDVFGEFNEKSVNESKKMAKEIKIICDSYKVDFMDAARYAEPALFDNIHMDAENHRKLAQGIYEKILALS